MIIDVRARLPLRRRLGSDLCTAGLWGFCAWLILPMIAPGNAKHVQLHHPVAAGISMPALNGVLGVLAFAIGVWVWMQARNRQNFVASQPAQPNYAQRFGLTEAQLLHYREAQTCTVHHNAAGDIVGIDTVAAVVSIEDAFNDAMPLPVPSNVADAHASFATAA